MARASAAKRVNGKLHYRGKTFRGFNKPQKSSSKNKDMEVLAKKGDEIKVVQFGDPNMSVKSNRAENKKSYCARSSGIKGANDKFSANYWSRKNWKC
jgi:hypothetical protein